MEDMLEFSPKHYEIKTAEAKGLQLTYRAFERIVYVAHPVDVVHQSLSIYVNEAYYETNGYQGRSLSEAPIFLPNGVGGYRPGEIEVPGMNPYTGMTNSLFAALNRGYVVVSPAVRGIGLENETGEYIGAAPACIVDYKAAVRYLRKNRDRIPGNVDRIISNGTSAGGALSSLLGITGNHPDYEPYLKEAGAANERDDIFAASCYCPITNLEHADMAYEWEFNGILNYHRMKFEMEDGKPKLTPFDGIMSSLQEQLSGQEKAMFPAYLNSLGLKTEEGAVLHTEADGSGSLREYVKSFLLDSAQRALEQGEDLSKANWLTVRGGKVSDVDFEKYVIAATRMKETPAFDSIELDTPENELFGSKKVRCRHFTAFSQEHSHKDGELAEEDQIRRMNPMNYLNDPAAERAEYFRIRHGAADRDTSLAIPVMLAAAIQNTGTPVDFRLPWGIPHSGDYDLDELFEWIERILG